MSAIASPSVKFPHQPVEIVQRPKPTSLTVKSVLLYVRKRIYNQLSECRSNVQPWTYIDITETDFQASQGSRAAKLPTSAPSSRSEREALGHEIRSMDYK